MIKHSIVTLILCVFMTGLSAFAAERPNIVVIMADDLGYADLGCYGAEIETPTLDTLANQGLRFSQFYNTAKCHSSRVSLLSGLYCDQAGSTSLSRGATIAEVLREAGYFTAMSGKWHLEKEPTDFGFDRYWGHLSGMTDFFKGNDTFRLNGNPWAVPSTLNGRSFYTTHGITDFAIDFMDEATKTEKPFFLYVAYNAPHYPLQAPKADIEKYEGKYEHGWDAVRQERHARQVKSGLLPAKWVLSPRPDHVQAWDSLSDAERQWESDRMEVYAAMVDVMDRSIGHLVQSLKGIGEYENTLILFLSDNGACPFERTVDRNAKPWEAGSFWTYDTGWAHAGNTPFRLYKQNQHEGGIASPLIAHWPKGLKATSGSISHQPGHIIDIMATCLEVGEAQYPTKIGERNIEVLEGQSLLPILQGKSRDPHETLYFHFNTDRALRQGPWKLVSAKLGRWELYNLEDDRTETNDLACVYPERVATMEAEWFRLAAEKDRLTGSKLAPVKEGLSTLNFHNYQKKKTR